MLQVFTFRQVDTGGVRQIDAKGNFFRYESGQAAGLDESIKVRADGNDLGTYYPGDSIELPVSVKRWEVIPTSVGCTGLVRVGNGRVQSARLVGTVQVIDGGRSRTLSGVAFLAPGSQPAVAAQNSHVQLWNPGAATRRLVLRQIVISSGTAGLLVVRSHNAALTTVVNSAYNKLIGAAAIPDAEVRAQTNAGALGATPLYQVNVAAGGSVIARFEEPVVIPPGFAVQVVHGVVNADVSATFDGYAELL